MSGADIVAAIALGARCTLIGRAYLYGLMAGGEAGVRRAVAILSGQLTRTMALRKVALAEDVARAVLVLASDELSGHVTGELVTVAGGMEGRTVHS